MSLNFMKIQKGINFAPQASAPSSPTNGDVYYNSTTNLFQFYQNGSFKGLGTGDLKADGTVPLTAAWSTGNFQIKEGDGTSSAPSYSFSTDATIGMYLAAAGTAAFGANGTACASFTSSLFKINTAFEVAGTALFDSRTAIGTLSTSNSFQIAGTTSSLGLTGTTQGNANFGTTFDLSVATAGIIGFTVRTNTAGNTHTTGLSRAINLRTPSIGTGDVITRNILLAVETPTNGTNNAFISDDTSSFTGNYWIYQTGTAASVFGGAMTIGSGTSQQHTLNTLLATNATNILTLTNAPAAITGNPTGYIQITVNGTTRYMPFW